MKLLRCPRTRQPVRWAETELLCRVNQRLVQGEVANCVGRVWNQELEGALVNASNTFLYPVVAHIPWLLPAEAIPLQPDLHPDRATIRAR